MYVNGLRVKEEYAFVINTLRTMVFCTGNVSSNNALQTLDYWSDGPATSEPPLPVLLFLGSHFVSAPDVETQDFQPVEKSGLLPSLQRQSEYGEEKGEAAAAV